MLKRTKMTIDGYDGILHGVYEPIVQHGESELTTDAWPQSDEYGIFQREKDGKYILASFNTYDDGEIGSRYLAGSKWHDTMESCWKNFLVNAIEQEVHDWHNNYRAVFRPWFKVVSPGGVEIRSEGWLKLVLRDQDGRRHEFGTDDMDEFWRVLKFEFPLEAIDRWLLVDNDYTPEVQEDVGDMIVEVNGQEALIMGKEKALRVLHEEEATLREIYDSCITYVVKGPDYLKYYWSLYILYDLRDGLLIRYTQSSGERRESRYTWPLVEVAILSTGVRLSDTEESVLARRPYPSMDQVLHRVAEVYDQIASSKGYHGWGDRCQVKAKKKQPMKAASN